MAQLNVVIVDATGNKEQRVGLPDDVKCGIIMVKLVEKIKLPSVGPDGNPISYKFIHKVSGRQLLEAQTLAEAGVRDGDVLRLQPEITAGAICANCGKQEPDGSPYCSGCGAPMNQSYAPAPTYSYPAVPVDSGDKTKLILILGIIAAALYIFASTIMNFGEMIGEIDSETWYFFNLVQDTGIGIFMLNIAFYMVNKLKKK